MVRAFLDKYPQYEIKSFNMPAVMGGSMDTQALMGIASGNLPHAMYVSFRLSSSYINHGFLVPQEILLARVLSDEPRHRQVDPTGRWMADPSPQQIDAARKLILRRVAGPIWPVIYRAADVQRTGIPDGAHVWAMPVETYVRALLYRKDVFQEAGLDPDRPPQDWDELMACARQIRTLPHTHGLMLQGGPFVSWGVYNFMVSNGVRYVDRTPDGDWRAAFATGAAAESIYFLSRLVNEPFEIDGNTYRGVAYVRTGGGIDARIKWERGQIGMQFDYLDREMLIEINPELVGIAPVPRAPGGTGAAEVNGRMLGVFSGSSPAQQLAVMRYIWFVTGDDAQRIRTRIFVQNGFGRFVNPDLLEKFGYDDVLRRVPPGWRETFTTALATGVAEPYGRGSQFIYHRVSEPINWSLQQPLLDLPREQALAKIRTQLDAAAQRVDQYLLGQLTPQQWSQRRAVGGIALALLFAAFIGSLYVVWRSFAQQEQAAGDRPRLRRFIPAYLMLSPALAIVLLWQYLPVALGAPLAFFDYELAMASRYVGIDNFATVLFDQRFWRSLGRTFYYVALVVGLGFWPPIMVAILLDEVPTTFLKYVMRTCFYLPAIVSGIILVFLWRQLFEPSESGFANQTLLLLNDLGPVAASGVKISLLSAWLGLIIFLLSIAFRLKELSWPVRGSVIVFAIGLLAATIWPLIEAYVGPTALQIEALKSQDPDAVIDRHWAGIGRWITSLFGPFQVEPLGWIQNPRLAMLCCVIPGVWAAAGPGCIIYLAALKTVPEDLIEAATIDGAGILQKIAYITLPRIKFLILIQLVGAIVGAFKGGTDFILAMTGGGPNGATRILGMDIFERTFMQLQYGVGAAMGWILGGLVIVLTAWQLKRMSRAEFRTAETANT